MTRAQQSWFLVLVRYRTHVPTHHFEICVLAGVIDCHLEHAQMEVGDWTERATCDQNDGLLLWVALQQIEAMMWESVIRRRGEAKAGCAVVLLQWGGHGGGL